MKNKKLYILILIFILVIILTYIFTIKKTEAPKIPENSIVNGTIETTETKPEIKITTDDKDKYVILNRNIVAHKDVLDKKKIVLLTIDDGPSSRTLGMIDILKKHNAKAIFFINGMHDKGYPNIIKQINDEGFAVGNHTWDHLNLKKEKNTKIIEKEINENSSLINKLTGTPPRFFRAPYGESDPSVRKLIKDDGMIMMDWSDAAIDWDKSTKDKNVFIKNVTNNLQSGSIILIHEHPWSLANLDPLLTTLESDGYTYVDPKNIVE
jgi:peptidoglycan/xylan/chitin deacetylase (PgdA/CDA1 family)